MGKTMWLVGQSDDWFPAVYSNEEDARAAVEVLNGERDNLWWYVDVEVNPRDPMSLTLESQVNG